MAKKKEWNFHVGKWAFLVGVVLAIIISFIGKMTVEIVSILVVIGIVAGLLTVRKEEVRAFLLSGTVLIIASSFGQNVFGIFAVLERMLQALLVIFVPAVIVVAIRNVFNIATS